MTMRGVKTCIAVSKMSSYPQIGLGVLDNSLTDATSVLTMDEPKPPPLVPTVADLLVASPAAPNGCSRKP